MNENILKKRKLNLEQDHDFINLDVVKDYKGINLLDYKDFLIIRRELHLKEINKINNLISTTNKCISDKCIEINKNHKWVRKEQGKIIYCDFCKCDFFNKIHIYD